MPKADRHIIRLSVPISFCRLISSRDTQYSADILLPASRQWFDNLDLLCHYLMLRPRNCIHYIFMPKSLELPTSYNASNWGWAAAQCSWTIIMSSIYTMCKNTKKQLHERCIIWSWRTTIKYKIHLQQTFVKCSSNNKLDLFFYLFPRIKSKSLSRSWLSNQF